MKLNFSILCYKDHIWSKIVINNLIKHNLIPLNIIEENSISGNKKKVFYDNLISDCNIDLSHLKSVDILAKEYSINYDIVNNHNNDITKELLCESSPDIILLSNTRIIKKDIFEIAKIGTFNCHPDKLPGYRGSVVYLRKILEDLQLGVTCHWVNEIVDTGSIVFYHDIEYNINDTLGDLVYKIILTSSNLFIKLLNSDSIPKEDQLLINSPCFTFPEDSIINQCRKKLDLKKNIIYNING
jgi:methionyl-tRNA formyltransferase